MSTNWRSLVNSNYVSSTLHLFPLNYPILPCVDPLGSESTTLDLSLTLKKPTGI